MTDPTPLTTSLPALRPVAGPDAPRLPFDLTGTLPWSLPGSLPWTLADFEAPAAAVAPLLWLLRQANVAADALFYDVAILALRLYTRGLALHTTMRDPENAARDQAAAWGAAAQIVDLSARANPEGSILVVHAFKAPFVRRFDSAADFLATGLSFSEGAVPRDRLRQDTVSTVAVTGVGSSALGAAAFAWNISEALHEPVAAIVPGFGLADIVPQALGGWFGFGLYELSRRMTEYGLAAWAPSLARVGRGLAASADVADPARGGRYRTGSAESDILHRLLEQEPRLSRLCGHSKGALSIQNAIRELPEGRAAALVIQTFGCVIREEFDADYRQVMGAQDGLGLLNSWGNYPERFVPGWHSTNSLLPLALGVTGLVKQDAADAATPLDAATLKTVVRDAVAAALARHEG
jgi:hypothetical protein